MMGMWPGADEGDGVLGLKNGWGGLGLKHGQAHTYFEVLLLHSVTAAAVADVDYDGGAVAVGNVTRCWRVSGNTRTSSL